MVSESPATEARPPGAVPTPDLRFERRAARRGAKVVAGVDEAGRGPLAGPVVVAAVILNRWSIPDGLNDSKVLTAELREELYGKIMKTATVAVVAAPPAVIYARNILQATLWAMRQAVLSLPVRPDHVLVDGNILPKELPCGGEAVVDGDARSVSIAAASIIAKVTRDRMCHIMHCEEPDYGFANHKGYSTPEHLAALNALGPGRHHRMDFAPCTEAQRLRASLSVTVEGAVVQAA
ncbi:MAG TPA: ribonuclease HII [Alphaproteobacteria bacterium]|nr:ribonuclease HII [Alphaproteobacteria bacterium]